MKYECVLCGNKRFFYHEVSVMAKQLIDQNKGTKDGKIVDIESNMVDNFFESVYCKKCNEKVEETGLD